MADWIDQLERLTKLHRDGALSDQEFADQKARLLAGRPAVQPAPATDLAGLGSDNPPFASEGIPLKWILIAVPAAILLGVLAWTQLIDSKGEIKPAPLPGEKPSASASPSAGASVAPSTVASESASPIASETVAIASLAPSPTPTQQPRTFNPSFSCAGQTNRVLLMICRDSELSRKDRDLSGYFRSALRQVDEQTRQDLLQKQRGFLRERNQCGNIGCLHAWYDRTISFYN